MPLLRHWPRSTNSSSISLSAVHFPIGASWTGEQSEDRTSQGGWCRVVWVPSVSVMLSGSVFPRTGHRKTDRPTNRHPCRPVYELLVIKKNPTQNMKKTFTLMHMLLLRKSLDCFISTFPSHSILRINLETYIFQSVLRNMSLIVWSKVAFSFVEWRRQMSLSPRMLVLSARCRAKMWSLLPGAHSEVLCFQKLYLAGIDLMRISLHMCETK